MCSLLLFMSESCFIISCMYVYCYYYSRIKNAEGVPYVLSDSDYEYSDTEKILLENARRGKNSDIEESEVS